MSGREDASGTTSSESLEILGKKINAVASVNQDIIDTIEAKKDDTVIIGFKYTLECQLNKREIEREQEKLWHFAAKPRKAYVQDRLDEFRYSGLKLIAAEDVFNDKIKYSMKTYRDVKRLNGKLQQVGSKYCNLLADKPATRSGARTFLSNLEIIQVALGQVHELIIDAEDTVNSTEVIEGLEEIVSGYRKVQQNLQNTSLDLSGNNQ